MKFTRGSPSLVLTFSSSFKKGKGKVNASLAHFFLSFKWARIHYLSYFSFLIRERMRQEKMEGQLFYLPLQWLYERKPLKALRAYLKQLMLEKGGQLRWGPSVPALALCAGSIAPEDPYDAAAIPFWIPYSSCKRFKTGIDSFRIIILSSINLLSHLFF